MKKILLIYPKNHYVEYFEFTRNKSVFPDYKWASPNTSLGTVAALTPHDEFEIKIIDENLEEIDFTIRYDLIGITGFTSQIYRAAEIAKIFSESGSYIVCGGPSVSLAPERWEAIADTLIIGEAEYIWPEFLDDFLSQKHKAKYIELGYIDPADIPVPDYSSYSKKSQKKFSWGIMQTSRGCPFKCEFCGVIPYMGNKMRYKPISTIIAELEVHYKLRSSNLVFLADDNFSVGRKKSKEILRALAKWNNSKKRPVSFNTQVSIDIAKDDEFLELAANAGLTRLFVGIETPNEKSLIETKKFQNLKSNVLEDIKRFQQYGINVTCASMVGFDNDDTTIFDAQLNFHRQSGIPGVAVYPLQALDGTALKERMIREGRYVDWDSVDIQNPIAKDIFGITMTHKQMTHKELINGSIKLLGNLYKPDFYASRFNKFLNSYNNSEIRKKLKIPSSYLDLKSFRMGLVILTFLLFRSTKVERRMFTTLLKIANKSQHPQKTHFMIEGFLIWKNSSDIQKSLSLK